MFQDNTRAGRQLDIELAEASLNILAEGVADEGRLDEALSLAEKFISLCGFDLLDSDQLGFEMNEIAQRRLAEAFLLIGLDDVAGAL